MDSPNDDRTSLFLEADSFYVCLTVDAYELGVCLCPFNKKTWPTQHFKVGHEASIASFSQ
jgi:hypothetical protein